MKKILDFREILKNAGEKATAPRLSLLETLSAEKYPISIKELQKKISGPDQSTLYRSLDALVSKKLVREINFDSTGAKYELAVGRPHHHHVVCTICGFMEDIEVCQKNTEKHVAVQTKKFKEITGHSLEFFGLCCNCSAR